MYIELTNVCALNNGNRSRKTTVKPGKTATRKKANNCFQDQLSHNAGQENCKMLQGEHTATLLTFIKLPFVIKMFVLTIFEWLFYTGLTVTFVSPKL